VKGIAGKQGQPRSYLLIVESPDRRPGEPANQERTPMVFAFRFDAGARSQLAGLDTGQMLIVEGVCEGKMTDASELITFRDCKVAKPPRP
jgi:hypothetical protein